MLPEPASLPLLPDARRHSVVVASTPPQPFHSPILRPPLPFWNSPSISSRTRLHLSRLRASPAFNLFSRWSDRTLTSVHRSSHQHSVSLTLSLYGVVGVTLHWTRVPANKPR